ncbi:MAG TPA: DUF3224 domain-containing protein [Terriglobales bacterium]|nr:DUF3224 domain-containing protein [Terriglobales bacterium]
MKYKARKALMIRVVAAAALCVAPAIPPDKMSAQSAQSDPAQQGKIMTKKASCTFDVKVIPQKPDNKEAEAGNFQRMSLDKQFHGDLAATSKGEMIGVMGEVKGSGGYVAMERVTGTLDGRKGTFALQHSGTMTIGVPKMTVTVVPDSGTGELTGLTGSLTIRIEAGGKHFYEFEYTLPQ